MLLISSTKAAVPATAQGQDRTRAGVLHHPRSHFPEVIAPLLSLLFLPCSRMAGASSQEMLLKAPLVQQPWLGRQILSDQFKQH